MESANLTYQILQGDCRKFLPSLEVPKESVQLVIADPPYNIGRKYDSYDDKRSTDEYLAMANEWIDGCRQVLRQDGSMWILIYDNLVSEVDVLCKQLGFHKRSHLIWAFTFGVNNPGNFTRSHTHMLYYTKDKKNFAFYPDQVKVPSLRQLKYKDKRANPAGRLPNDVWLMDLNEVRGELGTDMDLWIESRVCGTFKERVKGSDNQLPEALVTRIVNASSKAGDIVLDPFSGTFTTGAVCGQTGRKFIGIELSENSITRGVERVRDAYRRPGGAGTC